MSKPLQIGIIGASAERGWAKESHVPAVQHLPGIELAAVVVNGGDKARAAAEAFGARVGYSDPQALFDDAAIDVVTVAVKVPDHHELVLGALRARKHVYCEWPLSPTLSQAQELAAAASEAGVRVALGLQARFNPAVVAASRMIGEGRIGRVLSVRAYSTTAAFGREIEPAMVFAEESAAGVNLVFIQGAHTVDLCIALAGELSDAAAIADRQYPTPSVQGENRNVQRETFDHLIATARLTGGGTLVSEIVGGTPPDRTPFRLEVSGEQGDLVIHGGALRGFQSGLLRLSLNGEEQVIDLGELTGLPEAAVNVGGVYARLRDDIRSDSALAPDFKHAVRLTRLVEDMIASSADGYRRDAADWPRRGGSSHA